MSSTVKTPGHAAHGAMLAERRVERWASAYRANRKKNPV